METNNIILAIIATVPVIVSLVIASTAAKRSAFEDLQKVVEELKIQSKDLKEALSKETTLREKLEKELDKERKRSQKWEDWAKRLANQLMKNEIDPVPFSATENVDRLIPPGIFDKE
jgi:Skp family chaperone for outer membrane proteins